MRPWHILLSILVPAVLTFGLRALPFLLLNKENFRNESSIWEMYFLWQLWQLLWYTA